MELDHIQLDRRNVLRLLAGAGFVGLAGCASSKVAKSTSTTSSNAASTSGTTNTPPAASTPLTRIPEETGGPYPADGTNGPDVLTENGIVRKDITKSFGPASGAAGGVPMTIQLKIVEVRSGKARAKLGVYAWHCTREGGYSLYSDTVAGENFLRGVQPTGENGVAEFTSIFPGAYPGRWPHVHFEVYEAVDAATSGGSKLATSQIALPADVCQAVYATSGYEQSVRNLAGTSLQSDMVFGDDGGVHELAAVTGSVADRYVVALTVPV